MSPWTVLKELRWSFMGSSQNERPASLPGSSRKIVRKVESYLQHQYSFKIENPANSTSVLIINIYEHKNQIRPVGAVLALIGAGASAPQILDQFLTKKKVTTQWHTAMVLAYGPLSGCHSGGWKNRFSQYETVEEKCDQVNAIERDKALAWVERI